MQVQSKRLEKIRHYRELELIPIELYLRQNKPQPPTGRLRAIARWLTDFLVPSTEPRIAQKVDANGLFYWRVFDPVTGETARLTSVKDVHDWIEQRYQRRSSIHANPSHSIDPTMVRPFNF
ncbi:MAG: hypothetical protein AAFY26_12660 [Cyanobacteria bacterium J06638_22]